MTQKRTLILGSSGYIGSALNQYLKSADNQFIVDGCDITAYLGTNFPTFLHDYDALDETVLEQYDAIVLLAGNSSVRSCEGSLNSVIDNNVTKFINLLNKLSRISNPNQILIYASSASVYGKAAKIESRETDRLPPPINHYDLTKQMIDNIAMMYSSKVKTYGLRFGTVCGASPNMRWDTILNSMFKDMVINNFIRYTSGSHRRAILDINKLCRTISSIIHSHDHIVPGIYNVFSFNSSISNIAQQAFYLLSSNDPKFANAELLEIKSKSTSVYDFELSDEKFKRHIGPYTGEYEQTYTDQVIISNILSDLEKNAQLK